MVYPPDAGTPIRNFNLALQTANHDVTVYRFSRMIHRNHSPSFRCVVAVIPAPPRRTRLRHLRPCRQPGTGHGPSLAVRVAASSRDDLPRLQPDVVQLQALDTAYVLPTVRAAAPRATVILDQHNAEYVLQQRALSVDWTRPSRWAPALYSALQVRRLRRYERAVCRECDVVLTVSAEDGAALERLGISTPRVVVPNGVDLSAYRGTTPAEELTALPGPHFVFPGRFPLNVDAAIWFARVVPRRFGSACRKLPVVAATTPDVLALHICPAWVTGPVRDARPYIAAATAVVVPAHGCGKLKVLEAAALSAPGTDKHAAEGYTVVNERDAPAATRLTDWPAACGWRAARSRRPPWVTAPTATSLFPWTGAACTRDWRRCMPDRSRARLALLRVAAGLASPGRATRTGELRLLVVRPDHLGDLVFLSPALTELRASLPEAHITLAVGPWGAGTAQLLPQVDRGGGHPSRLPARP